MNWLTEICSALKLKKAGGMAFRAKGRPANAFFKVFLRWLKAVLTKSRNCSSGKLASSCSGLRIKRITAESTLGGGLKASGGSVNSNSVW